MSAGLICRGLTRRSCHQAVSQPARIFASHPGLLRYETWRNCELRRVAAVIACNERKAVYPPETLM
jgi:hypothetical protein